MPDDIPSYLGGDDPWAWLRPDTQADLVEKLSDEQKATRHELASHFARAFKSRSGREVLAFFEQHFTSQSFYSMGLPMEQATVMAIGSDAQRQMVNFIKQQIEIAEATE